MSISDQQVEEIPLGEYIFRRLRSVGIHHVFGCPGDFNLTLLDHVSTVSSMNWVGTCNELNAAYAADGYSRIRGIPGVLVTTYGVGELSAINGVSGAYSEHVAMIHIVGTTSRLAQKGRIMIHHTLKENFDHTTFQRMSEPVRAASAFLTNDYTFAEEVDRIIESAFKMRRPVYLFVPMDTPDILIDGTRLSKPLDIIIKNSCPDTLEDEIVESVIRRLEDAQSPAILLDVLAHRYGVVSEARELVRKTRIPTFVTPLAKGLIDETSIEFIGLYNGKLSPIEAVKQQVESSDVILHIGPLLSDSNTGGWSQSLPIDALITLGYDSVSCGGKMWDNINFAPVLKKLAARVRTVKAREIMERRTPENGYRDGISTPTGLLEQHYFWRTWSGFLRPGDLIISEVGTAQFGTLELELPTDTEFFSQFYYSSIGFSVGALLGAFVARQENGNEGRVLLFVGDGSLQMTVQELSTVIRLGFNPIIILVNNSGYTVERVIHGPAQNYNDISDQWDYQGMLRFFGARKSKSYTARTYEELAHVLEDPEFVNSPQPRLLEVFMDKFDSPWMLTAQVKLGLAKTAAQLSAFDEKMGRRRVVLDSSLYQSTYALKISPSNVYLDQRKDLH